MFESLESRMLMSGSLLGAVTGLVSDIGGNVAGTIVSKTHVTAKIDVNTVLHTCIDAKVFTKLGLTTSVHIGAGANIRAIVGLCSNLTINTKGILCNHAGLVVDLNAVLCVLTRLGATTKVAVDVNVGVKLLAQLGIHASVKLSATAQLNACVSSLASAGVSLIAHAGISLSL